MDKEPHMVLANRLTRRLGIEHPIVLAPLDQIGGGTLAKAVSDAGGFGVLGGGYGDRGWLEMEFPKAGDAPIGVGFITWSLAKQPQLLDLALAHKPKAVMLSFGDPAPFVDQIHAASALLIAQVNTLDQARHVLDLGADIVVAQGTEAGGHSGAGQGTMAFTPQVADRISRNSYDALLLAAGGIADGRGLAAALILGADGVMMGTRFSATQEALTHPAAKARLVAAGGDETARTSVYDILRERDWPAGYRARFLRNGFLDRWEGDPERLAAEKTALQPIYKTAVAEADFDIANIGAGESVGLVHDLPPAGDLVRRIAAQAAVLLA
jgi:nitronate monooxygenase